MMNKAINTLVLATVDSLTKFKKKLSYYSCNLCNCVIGSTFGTYQLQRMQLSFATENDVWHDWSNGVVGAVIAAGDPMVLPLNTRCIYNHSISIVDCRNRLH